MGHAHSLQPGGGWRHRLILQLPYHPNSVTDAQELELLAWESHDDMDCESLSELDEAEAEVSAIAAPGRKPAKDFLNM